MLPNRVSRSPICDRAVRFEPMAPVAGIQELFSLAFLPMSRQHKTKTKSKINLYEQPNRTRIKK